MSSREGTKNIRVILILEALGRPPEHLTETLEALVKQIDQEKGVKVISKKINKPVEIKDSKGFYTTFAEIEVEVEEILMVAILMFKYMPANVEIIEPELIALTNSGWNDIFNELTRRLHAYDELARILQTERAIIEKKFQEIAGNQQVKKKPEKKSISKKQGKKSVKKK